MALDGYQLLRDAGTVNCLSIPEKVSVLIQVLSELGGITPPPVSDASVGYLGAPALRNQTVHDADSEQASIAFLIYAVSVGDGSQGWFYWDVSSVAADDGVNIIRANDNLFPAPGAWIRLS